MEKKCGQSKPDQVDQQKFDEVNRNHPANKKDESELKMIFFLVFKFTRKDVLTAVVKTEKSRELNERVERF